MFDSKLITLFKSLKKDERIQIRKWIRSEFVNKNEDIVNLFDFIDSRKEIKENVVKKQKVFEHLFEGQPYDDAKLRHLMSFTSEIIEEFFIWHYFSIQPFASKLTLIKYYSRNKMNKYFNECVRTLNKDLSVTNKRDIDYYRTKYELELEKNRVVNYDTRNSEDNFSLLFEQLHVYTIVEILRNACNAIPYKDLKDLQFDIPLLQPILDLLKNGKYSEINILQIYYLLFITLSENAEAYFENLILLIKKSELELSQEELKDIYLLCINFCIKKFNKEGNLNFAKYAYELYITSIDNGCLLEGNELSRFSFTNIVTFGLKIKNPNEVEQFINEYKKFLSPTFEEATVSYNMCKIHFLRNQFDKAMSLLMSIEYKDIMWNINAKYLLLKILYVTNQMDTLETFLNSFNVFIHRQKEIGYHKEYFNQIIKQLNVLSKLSKMPKRARAPKVVEYLEKTILLDKEWFQIRFDELLLSR